MSFSNIIQTFTPQAAVQCGGCNLYFTAAGGDVVVTLGTVDGSGMPAKPLMEKRIARAAVQLGGSPTQVAWPAPHTLAAGTTYAIAVSAADTTTALVVAQIGEADQTGGRVTAAQADVGTLLHLNESNVPTRYATRMLQFDLLEINYTAATKTVVVGTQAVVGATSLLIAAAAEQPDSDARVSYVMELFDAANALVATYAADAGQVVRMDAPHTGTVKVKATLRRGANGLGPVIGAGALLGVGALVPEGDYITPAIATAGGSDLRVIFEALAPAGSGVSVHTSVDGGAWTLAPNVSASPQTAGVLELTHRLEGIDGDSLRLRLSLTGAAAARPMVSNLRAVVL